MNENYKKIFGKNGENLAIEFLKKNKWEILEKNYFKNKIGEIDIIAKKDKIISFIEVKSRKKNYLSPGEIVLVSKQKKIIKTAEIYLLEKNIDTNDFVIRFDLIYLENEIVSFFENAFQK